MNSCCTLQKLCQSRECIKKGNCQENILGKIRLKWNVICKIRLKLSFPYSTAQRIYNEKKASNERITKTNER